LPAFIQAGDNQPMRPRVQVLPSLQIYHKLNRTHSLKIT